MGLYRTLLYQILTVVPGLTEKLLPDQWTAALARPKVHSAWEILDDDIKEAYVRLSKKSDGASLDEYCFCFFVDGLDEYEATTSVDRRDLVRTLMDLASSISGKFKICVSSRIENPFMDMFSEAARFYLHKLTKLDMEKYTQGKLQHIGTNEERQQLTLSITNKAEGVFLWVVLVVQKIRKRSDDGAGFSRLLSEIESLPSELNELFQRIIDPLEIEDRRLVSHAVSILHFLSTIPKAKQTYLWLNLSDFNFLEDYEADPLFAENTLFPQRGYESVKESKKRAMRQMRGVFRGLIEANRAKDLEFVHRSVDDFFRQKTTQISTHDESFNDIGALSQLKLASMKQFWWDREQHMDTTHDKPEAKEKYLTRHSILISSLIRHRRRQQLDVAPFSFFKSLETIPEFSLSKAFSRALSCGKTAFRTNLSLRGYKGRPPHSHYEFCHISQVRHMCCRDTREKEDKDWQRYTEKQINTNNSQVLWFEICGPLHKTDYPAIPGVIWRDIEEYTEEAEEYSIPVISPLFIELCSGRLEYPAWRMQSIHELPLDSDSLVMLAYCAIATGVGRFFWAEGSIEDGDDNEGDVDNDLSGTDISITGCAFLKYLFHQKFMSPNLPTRLAFGSQFASVRIAIGSQQLSLWQHFFCWWATVSAASGDFEVHDRNSAGTSEEEGMVCLLMAIFIENGADLKLALKIGDRRQVPTGAGEVWLAYTLELVADGDNVKELDVVVNIHNRACREVEFPYGPPWRMFWKLSNEERLPQPLPNSYLSVREWIHRSQLPTKNELLEYIDKRNA